MSDPLSAHADAVTIASAVAARQVSAGQVVEAALARIAAGNPHVNAFVTITAGRTRAQAEALDRQLARGAVAGPLAGVPFAVKAMIDLEGVTTTAGSLLYASNPPAARDAAVVQALHQAGAVCLGTTNMDEFGLGGTTENSHYGVTHNPHDLSRTPGGSSGGSAAALAAGFVPISLGSDGLGSIRLPASLCGVFGLRPTLGSVSSDGIRGSGMSLGTIGPMTRSARDLALVFDVIREKATPDGPLPPRGTAPAAELGLDGLRFARVGGYFEDWLDADARTAWQVVCEALGAMKTLPFPEPDRARAAAMIINLAENGHYQLDDLRRCPEAFDPKTRGRFFAGARAPAAWYLRAKAFQSWHRERVLRLLRKADVIVTPATPCVAPVIGSPSILIGGVEHPTGPILGLLTQPVALTGCPALTIPLMRTGRLPVGVQLVAAPGCEANLLRAARRLEQEGVCRSTPKPSAPSTELPGTNWP